MREGRKRKVEREIWSLERGGDWMMQNETEKMSNRGMGFRKFERCRKEGEREEIGVRDREWI